MSSSHPWVISRYKDILSIVKHQLLTQIQMNICYSPDNEHCVQYPSRQLLYWPDAVRKSIRRRKSIHWQ